jgi:hypothetical protein
MAGHRQTLNCLLRGNDMSKSNHDEALEDILKAKAALNLADKTEEIKYPDAIKHKYISFVKSGFRILAGITLCFGEFVIAGVLLIVAEVLGVAEELV